MKDKEPNIRILTIRDQKVVLDVDLAEIYGVPTRVLNQALRRNKRRFPADFAFQLSGDEYDVTRSQIVIAPSGAKNKRSQIVIGSSRNIRYRPSGSEYPPKRTCDRNECICYPRVH